MSIVSSENAFSLLKQTLPAFILIGGAEELLNIEALNIVRQNAKNAGFLERQRLESEDISNIITELNSPSLFSPKRIIEWHLKEKKLTKAMIEMVEKIGQLPLNEQTKCIIFAPQLEKIEKQNWFKKVFSPNQHLAIISKVLYPNQFAQYLVQKLERANLQLTTGAFEQLLMQCHGNLLAAQQVIDRLMISPFNDKKIDEKSLSALLEDQAQFNAFALSEAILQANWLKAYRIVRKLEAESPTDNVLITWILQRDITLLLALQNAEKSHYSNFFKQYNIYKTQQVRYEQAINLYHPRILRTTLQLLAKLDRIIKGDETGNFWLTLSQYLLLNAKKA